MNNKRALIKQVGLLREFYKISIYPKEVDCLARECDLENYFFTLRNNLYYEQLMLSDLGIDEPMHRASLIGFPAEDRDGVQWFLVDPTYGQFFRNENFANYMLSNYKDFSLELLNNGVVECTLQNIYSYIHGFMFSNGFTKNADTKLVYKNLYDVLQKLQEIDKKEASIKIVPKEEPKKRRCLFKRKRNR